MKIYICDNNTLLCEHTKSMIYKIFGETQADVSVFNNAQQLLAEIQNALPDFILLDISLGNDYGIDIALKLNKISKRIRIIYITSHLEYIKDICDTSYDNILIKPIEAEKLKKVLSVPKEDFLLIKTANHVFNINQSEILYIESKKRVAYIYTENETITSYTKLTDMLPKLNESFALCHKSYIINMNKIYKFNNSLIELNNGIKLPVSRANLKTFHQNYTNFLGGLL